MLAMQTAISSVTSRTIESIEALVRIYIAQEEVIYEHAAWW